MTKYLQNRIAESRYTLPVVSVYGIIIWLLCGLLHQHWWIQFVCFILSTYLMIEFNNSNALIRIYSRSVSAAYIVLCCVACFLFPSIPGAITALCIVASMLTLLKTYQDKTATGWTFYTYLLLGLASLVDVHFFWFIPLYWILQLGFVFSLSFRTFSSSLLGLVLPYWFLACWLFWNHGTDFSLFLSHFEPLGQFQTPFAFDTLTMPQILTLVFCILLTLTGTIHYLRTSFNDKIRIRQIFYSFIFLDVIAAFFVILQPQHYDLGMRMVIITTSPMIGHFISLTRTRVTNIAFLVITSVALILTLIHLWSSSFIF